MKEKVENIQFDCKCSKLSFLWYFFNVYRSGYFEANEVTHIHTIQSYTHTYIHTYTETHKHVHTLTTFYQDDQILTALDWSMVKVAPSAAERAVFARTPRAARL